MLSQPRNSPLQPGLLPVQEDFYLLDVIGGSSHTVMHPTRPIVAYTSGNKVFIHTYRLHDNSLRLNDRLEN